MTAPSTRNARPEAVPAAVGLALALALGACASDERVGLAALEAGYDPGALSPFAETFVCPAVPRGRYSTRFRWFYRVEATHLPTFEAVTAGSIAVTVEAERAVIDYAVTDIDIVGRAFAAAAGPFFTTRQVVPRGTRAADATVETTFRDWGRLPGRAVLGIKEELSEEVPMGAPFLPVEGFTLAMGEVYETGVPAPRFGAGIENMAVETSSQVVGMTELDLGGVVVVRAVAAGTAKIDDIPVAAAMTAELFYDPESCAIVANQISADLSAEFRGRTLGYRIDEALWTEGWRGAPSETVSRPTAVRAGSDGAGAAATGRPGIALEVR